MKNSVKKIVKYISKTTQENTSKEEFKAYLIKFSLNDIVEAYTIVKKYKEVQNG